VSILKMGNDGQKLWAAEALRYLTIDNNRNRVEIAKKGAVEPS
jgi:hypothetical protein